MAVDFSLCFGYLQYLLYDVTVALGWEVITNRWYTKLVVANRRCTKLMARLISQPAQFITISSQSIGDLPLYQNYHVQFI